MGTRTVNTDLLREVVKADPDFYREKVNQPEYEFSNSKTFKANPANRGAYASEG